MAEQIDLAAPTGPQTSAWQVKRLILDRGFSSDAGAVVNDPTKSLIQVTLIGANGRTLVHKWSGLLADADIVLLNKLDLRTNSLQRRILSKLVTDGVIAGTISGTPD